MADVKPFCALRYDERAAGPLESLVAPPYDVISAEQRESYLTRSPYNVVRLTLPDDEEKAAELLTEWQDEGVLVRDDEPTFWWLSQEYVGPDKVRRRRDGLVVGLRVEPYEKARSCRTSGRTPGRRRGGYGCCARCARTSSRSSCSTMGR